MIFFYTAIIRLCTIFSLVFISIFCFSQSAAQNKLPINEFVLVPEPAYMEPLIGRVDADSVWIIAEDSTLNFSRDYLQQHLKKNVSIISNSTATNKRIDGIPIILKLDETNKNPSAYILEATSDRIQVSGNSSGVFYGVQTLIQLLSNGSPNDIPSYLIKDSARFSWRGLHLDVGRHFQPVSFIKQYLDWMAFHKLNTFHWHLTEDQGWRIEIKKFPGLTHTGSRRKQTLVGPYGTGIYDGMPHDGFYTQAEIKEIVQYAADRQITIVPEIEMPGHSLAALSAYPELGCTGGPYQVMETWGVSEEVMCAGSERTFEFLEQVLIEVMDLFPGPVLHVGGDECPKERWKHCKRCQERMRTEGLSDEQALQSYFMRRIEKLVNQRGKRIIGWDEILEGGLPPQAMVMSWRGETGGIEAAKLKHNVVMCPGKPLYFDHTQRLQEDSVTQGGYNPLEAIYSFNPIPLELDPSLHGYILGAQANVWTEYMRYPSKIEYMLFPRIAALSEMLWTPDAKKSWTRFEKKIPKLFSWYKSMGIRYSDAFYDLKASWDTDAKGNLSWKLQAKQDGGMIMVSKPNKRFKKYQEQLLIQKAGLYRGFWQSADGKQTSDTVQQLVHVNKATGKLVKLSVPPSSSYSTGGVLTMTDGVHNTSGMSKSAQFLGFWGDDVELDLDLGKRTKVRLVKLRSFEQAASWIYAPKSVMWEISEDGKNYTELNDGCTFDRDGGHLVFSCKLDKRVRFIRAKVKNHGTIESGNPGAGHPAWLFLDEIQVF
jgi:hexosaminidase